MGRRTAPPPPPVTSLGAGSGGGACGSWKGPKQGPHWSGGNSLWQAMGPQQGGIRRRGAWRLTGAEQNPPDRAWLGQRAPRAPPDG